MRIARSLAILLVLACAGSPRTPAASSGAPAAASAEARAGRRLMVVGLNDTHGALLSAPPPKLFATWTKSDIGGADWMAGYMTAIRADYAQHGDEVILLDAGDAFQGTLISNEFRGKSVVDVYNVLGVNAAAIGNHDFDFGIPVLKERMAQSKFPWLSANVFIKGTRN